MSNQEDIENYAKHLFFENKTFRDIARLVEEKFQKKIGHTTIKLWSDKKGWRAEKDLAQVRGVIKAKKDSKQKNNNDSEQMPLIGADEKILEEIVRDTAKQYKESQEIREIGLGLIKAITRKQDERGKLIYDKNFNAKSLTAAVACFKAGSDDMRKIESMIDFKQAFRPEQMTDEELEEIARSNV